MRPVIAAATALASSVTGADMRSAAPRAAARGESGAHALAPTARDARRIAHGSGALTSPRKKDPHRLITLIGTCNSPQYTRAGRHTPTRRMDAKDAKEESKEGARRARTTAATRCSRRCSGSRSCCTRTVTVTAAGDGSGSDDDEEWNAAESPRRSSFRDELAAFEARARCARSTRRARAASTASSTRSCTVRAKPRARRRRTASARIRKRSAASPSLSLLSPPPLQASSSRSSSMFGSKPSCASRLRAGRPPRARARASVDAPGSLSRRDGAREIVGLLSRGRDDFATWAAATSSARPRRRPSGEHKAPCCACRRAPRAAPCANRRLEPQQICAAFRRAPRHTTRAAGGPIY